MILFPAVSKMHKRAVGMLKKIDSNQNIEDAYKSIKQL